MKTQAIFPNPERIQAADAIQKAMKRYRSVKTYMPTDEVVLQAKLEVGQAVAKWYGFNREDMR